jgi:cytochrome oxidase Cu insertion factor (SCO1/SenC/PrrC family)
MKRKIPAKSSDMMKNPLAMVAIVAIAAGAFGVLLALLVYATGGLVNKPAASQGQAAIGGAFSLVDQDGKAVTDQDFKGKFALIFFGYTYCPDVCPGELQTIAAALDKLGSAGDKLVPVFISVDPSRDTVSQMAQYVKNFHPRLVGLTGSEEQVRTAAKAYHVYYAKAENPSSPDAYAINHSAYAYLMGPDGRFVKHFAYGMPEDKLAEALLKAMAGT